MKLTTVTSALHACEAGDSVTIRGPYGDGLSLEDWKDKKRIRRISCSVGFGCLCKNLPFAF